MTKKVVVTGGAGFIGGHVVDALIGAGGYDVHVVDNLSSGDKSNINLQATFHQVDIQDQVKLKEIFAGAVGVFHFAADPRLPYSIEAPLETNKVNVDGTLSVLLAAKEAKVGKVIYSASCAAYGDATILPIPETAAIAPKSPYALQKYVGELYAQVFNTTYGLKTVSFRYFNVYGSRQKPDGAYAAAIPKFIALRKEDKPLTIVGDGKQTRDFIHVSDVARANVLALESDAVGAGEVINIGSGIGRSVAEIANLVGGPIEYLPARPEIRDSRADIKKAKSLLDWEPQVSFEAGIAELKKLAGLV